MTWARAIRRIAVAAAWSVSTAGLLAATTAPVSAEVEVSERARALFRDGVGHLKATPPRYAEAYEAFKAAYEESPSPKILGNLGLCATMLERDGEAIAAYRRYLEEAGAKSDRENQDIRADLDALEARVSRLSLSTSPPRVTVVDRRLLEDGRTVENRYELETASELGLRAGEHRLTISAEGHVPQDVTLTLAPGDRTEREVALVPIANEAPVLGPDHAPSDEEASSPVGLWIALGATGALAVATAVVGGLAADNHGDFEEALTNGDSAEATRLRDRGGDLNIAGDVLLGATLAGAAVSAVLLIVELTREDESPLAVTPVITPQSAFFGVSTRF